MHSWIRYRSIGYMCGKGLTFGVGPQEILPRAAVMSGCYALNMDIVPHATVDICDERLSVVADSSLDWVFVGERLGTIQRPEEWLRTARGRLRRGGHMILALPIGRDDLATTNTRFSPNVARRMIEGLGAWQEKAALERDGWLYQVYKKLDGRRGIVPARVPQKPRACVVRYGALGDMIMIAPLLKRLAADGYEVTVNATPYSSDVLANNPYVTNIVVQERDAIPNPELGPYWDEWRGEYDRWINLSETIEGMLLKVEGRREFYTHKAWRHAQCDKNYYDYTMERGGYPGETGTRGEIYLSKDEERAAQRFVRDLGAEFVVLWALNGTSHHKVYPLAEQVITQWLEEHPRAKVITVGALLSQVMEFEHPRVVPLAGRNTIRESLALTKVVDLVVGPESVIINASGCWDTPKIPLLSHSTHENLCKYFENDYCLSPNVELAPCYPCHQLKYSLTSCPQGELKADENGEVIARGPICAMGAIEPERLLAQMNKIYAVKHTN